MNNKYIAKLKFLSNEYLYFFCTIICSYLYSILIYNKSFPLPEGWYSYYSQCINSGLKVYIDFEYLFFPLYIEFIAFITKHIGYEILSLRILGVIIFILITIVLFFIFKKLFTPFIAMVSSLVAVFYMQSEIVQVFCDYVRFMDLFALISMLLFLYMLESIWNNNNKKAYIYTTLSAISVSFFIFIKQNMGILFWIYIVTMCLFLYIYSNYKRLLIKVVFIYIFVSITTSFIIFMLLIGIENMSIMLNLTVIGAASAKGNLFSILFGWLLPGRRPYIISLIVNSSLPILFLLLNFNLNKEKFNKFNIKILKTYNILFITFCIFGIYLCYICQSCATLFSDFYNFNLWTIYFTNVILFIFFLSNIIYNYLKNRPMSLKMIDLCFIFGAVFTIGFGCGTSGGLAQGQLGLALGLIVALMLSFSYNKFYYVNIPIILLFSLLCILSSASFKYLHPYNWWGFSEPSIYAAKETTKIPFLTGIKVSKNTKSYLETIYDIVQNNTKPSDSIFCFPQIPVLYTLCGRKDPGTFTKVQWFDVATDKNIFNDIKIIKDKKPKVIIINNVPDWAVSAHENMFRNGNKSGYTIMKDFLTNFVNDNNNNYNYIKRIDLNGTYFLEIYVRDSVNINSDMSNFILEVANGYDFTKTDSPSFLKVEKGISKIESWGRWSDANLAPIVSITFSENLPNIFILDLKARAFGPNIGKTLTIKIGKTKYFVLMSKENFEFLLNVDLKGEITDTIEFIPPAPNSPYALWIDDEDNRKLGVGFKTLKIFKSEKLNSHLTIIDFMENILPDSIESTQGLSIHETWGRWSDANLAPSVCFNFKKHLPSKFYLFIDAVAFGPNVGEKLVIKIGKQVYQTHIASPAFESKIAVDLHGEKTKKIEFISPKPSSPQKVSGANDTRKLGIGFHKIVITSDAQYKLKTFIDKNYVSENYISIGLKYDKREYLKNNITAYDVNKAFNYYMLAAKLGNKKAQRLLVGLYRRGWGCNKSYIDAIKWLLISHGFIGLEENEVTDLPTSLLGGNED